MDFSIDSLQPTDWPAVRAIYLEGIATGNATFETTAPEWEGWDAAHLPECRLAARAAGELRGWATLTRVSGRRVYAGLAEVSVYVAAGARGHGVGQALLNELVIASEAAGFWTLQAGIFPENAASIAIHRKAGFRVVGVRERLGALRGKWRDVALLERRSAVMGT